MRKVPIVIIGGGPVGMVLALLLDQLGVRSLIINKEIESRWHPKGNTHNSRTMEHYRRLGLSKSIRSFGLPKEHPTDVGYFTSLAGFEVARIRMPSEAQKMRDLEMAQATDQIVEPIFRCNQMYVERFLYEQIHLAKNVACRFGWECIDWQDRGDSVQVQMVDVVTAQPEIIECDYLVGCDGGNSIVRRKLGIRYRGDPHQEQAWAGGLTASTFLHAPDFYRKAIGERPLCWQYMISNPRVRANFVALDGKGLFLFSTRLIAEDNEKEKEVIDRRLRMCVGAEADFEYLGHFSWTAGQGLVADSYGNGRVAMAGDSVHLFTPQGGFGMNTGIDDVANLAWKLAALVQGWGGKNLLNSYSEERQPVAIRNTRAAQQMARRIGAKPVADEIESTTLEGEQARRRAAEFYMKFTETYGSIGIQLGARYDSSSIIVHDGLAPPDNHDQYIPTSSPGGRAPHVWLAKNQSLFDRFGRGFTLLRLTDNESKATEFQNLAKDRRVPLNTLSVHSDHARQLYEADFALIRPDQHVAWRGNIFPPDVDSLVATVTGAH